jgi:hypothetical protein
VSGHILQLSFSHSPVFLLNSRLSHFSAASSRWRPFSRSYGAILPSSLTVNLPYALVFSTGPPVSVFGTGCPAVMLSGFSWKRFRCLSPPPEGRRTVGFRLSVRICLYRSTPSAFNPDIRHRAAPCSLRPRFAHSTGSGILTGSAIGFGSRLILSPRLTLIRLALIRNPWSFGGGASRPPCRYSFLHLLFRALQLSSRRAFYAAGMLPYH